jgi:hypothetical protein
MQSRQHKSHLLLFRAPQVPQFDFESFPFFARTTNKNHQACYYNNAMANTRQWRWIIPSQPIAPWDFALAKAK